MKKLDSALALKTAYVAADGARLIGATFGVQHTEVFVAAYSYSWTAFRLAVDYP